MARAAKATGIAKMSVEMLAAGRLANVLQQLFCRRFAGPDFCFIFARCGSDGPEILPS
jgi:hypothetical protein